MQIPDGARVLRVKVYPDAGEDRVTAKSEEEYEVWTRAEARNNQANREVLYLLARSLSLPMNRLSVLSGHRSSAKKILIRS
jgi:uncharacterized protein YggU (UPF0235/DUF167 family)